MIKILIFNSDFYNRLFFHKSEKLKICYIYIVIKTEVE